MMKLAWLSAAAFLLHYAPPAGAQVPRILMDTRDAIQGVGTPVDFGSLAINDDGTWMLVVDTDNPDTSVDEVVLRNGFVSLQEGTLVGSPQGATIAAVRDLNIDSRGNGAWSFLLNDPNTLDGLNEGVYWNTRMVALSLGFLNTPGYSPSARWDKFNGFVKYNDLGQILVASEVDDPVIPGVSDQSIILLTLDATGNLIGSVDVAHEQGNAPGLPNTIVQDGIQITKPTAFALDNNGNVLWQARMNGFAGSRDRAIFLNEQILVQEGDPSPIAGLNWGTLVNSRVDLNDEDGYVYEGTLTPAPQNRRMLLVSHEGPILRERESLPQFSPRLINDFGAGTPLLISNDGDVYYRVTLTGTTSVNAAFLRNRETLIEKGRTQTSGGQLVFEFIDDDDSLAISPGGRFVLSKVMTNPNDTAILLQDLGRVRELTDCSGNPGTLTRKAGVALPGATLTVEMDQGQGSGVSPVLLLSDAPIAGFPPCGLVTSLGELVISFDNGNPFQGFFGTPWAGTPVPFDIDIANNFALVERKFYAQGIFVNFNNVAPGAPLFQMTNAIEIHLGLP